MQANPSHRLEPESDAHVSVSTIPDGTADGTNNGDAPVAQPPPSGEPAHKGPKRSLQIAVPNSNKAKSLRSPVPSFIRPASGWRCRFCWCCECSKSLATVFAVISVGLTIAIGVFGYYLFFTNQGISDFLFTYDTLRCEGTAYSGKLWVHVTSLANVPSKDDLSNSDVYFSVYTDAAPGERVDSEVALNTATDTFNELIAVCIPVGTTKVYVDVMDKDAIGANDFIGLWSYTFSDLVTGTDGLGNTPATPHTLRDAAGNTLTGTVTASTSFFPTDTVANVAASLESGDIVLFSGDTASGAVIRIGTQSQWSHIGVALVQNGIPYVIESSTNVARLHDCYDGNVHTGVEMVHFVDKVMCGYYSFVAVRKLQLTGSITRQDVHDRLVTYFTSMQNTPYEFFEVEMLGSAFGWNIIGDSSSLFCSEFVAYAMHEAGVLQADQLSNNYMPRDFSSEVRPALVDAELGNEVYMRGVQDEGTTPCADRPGGCQCTAGTSGADGPGAFTSN